MLDTYSLSANDMQLYNRITDILLRFGIPPCSKGFEYLRCGIMITYNTPDATELITKTLYPTIARMCHAASAEGIGRGCRRAIEFAFDDMKVREYFGSDKPPKCSEFISATAEHMHRSTVVEDIAR